MVQEPASPPRKRRSLWPRLFRRFAAGDAYLLDVSGVMHIGANAGQERKRYERLGLEVLWVEPIPDVFARLQANIAPYPRQRALQYLLTDCDDRVYTFHVASNDGASSSILPMAQHRDVWPNVRFVDTLELTGHTLATMVKRERIDLGRYQALVMDTQGSELLVLLGAGELLRQFRYVKTEAADFESYAGCCRVADLVQYLAGFGFKEAARVPFAEHAAGGHYYDLLFERAS